ncbi:MAG TPA: hypothetical protein VGC08_08350 [Pedobacter sp.]
MTDEQITEQIAVLKAATAKASRTKETAINFLVAAGIIEKTERKASHRNITNISQIQSVSEPSLRYVSTLAKEPLHFRRKIR